jgi:hypothetical protein
MAGSSPGGKTSPTWAGFQSAPLSGASVRLLRRRRRGLLGCVEPRLDQHPDRLGFRVDHARMPKNPDFLDDIYLLISRNVIAFQSTISGKIWIEGIIFTLQGT